MKNRKKTEETEIEKKTKDEDLDRNLKHAREMERIKRETKSMFGATRRQKKVINFNDQRAQILEIWNTNFNFGDMEKDEMVLCTAHHELQHFHFMSIFDALAFDTEMGEPSEERRENLAPGCATGIALMGIAPVEVFKRPSDNLIFKLFQYFSNLLIFNTKK